MDCRKRFVVAWVRSTWSRCTFSVVWLAASRWLLSLSTSCVDAVACTTNSPAGWLQDNIRPPRNTRSQF